MPVPVDLAPGFSDLPPQVQEWLRRRDRDARDTEDRLLDSERRERMYRRLALVGWCLWFVTAVIPIAMVQAGCP